MVCFNYVSGRSWWWSHHWHVNYGATPAKFGCFRGGSSWWESGRCLWWGLESRNTRVSKLLPLKSQNLLNISISYHSSLYKISCYSLFPEAYFPGHFSCMKNVFILMDQKETSISYCARIHLNENTRNFFEEKYSFCNLSWNWTLKNLAMSHQHNFFLTLNISNV